MKILRITIIAVLVSLLFGCSGEKRQEDIAQIDSGIEKGENGMLEEENIKSEEDKLGEDNKSPLDPIEEKIKSMTLEEKVGQLIIAGFEGYEFNEKLLELIEEYKLGGFILFSRNIRDEDQVLTLLNDIKKSNFNSDVPLFLSIDEEGGLVSRLPISYLKLPEAMKLGKKNNRDLSYEFGELIGLRVKSLGFNMVFAPVLDINSNPKNPVIGNRSFGNNPNQVVATGIQVMEGIRRTETIPSVKHFPGHGDTGVDSHVNLPRVDKTLEELEALELIPFREAIKEDVETVMVAHILYPEIDDEHPATMSDRIINDLLRKELDFKGLVISDDMTMGAIMNNYTLEEGVLSFLKSGGDIALVCHGIENPKKVIKEIIESVNNGRLREEDVDNKVYRILSLKEKYKLKDELIEEVEIEDLNKRTKELIDRIRG